MKKLFNLLAALFIVAAVCLGTFLSGVPGATIGEIAAASFALLFTILSAYSAEKEKGAPSVWFYVTVVLAVIGGALFAIGGAASSIITEIIAATAGLLAIISAIIAANTKKE